MWPHRPQLPSAPDSYWPLVTTGCSTVLLCRWLPPWSPPGHSVAAGTPTSQHTGRVSAPPLLSCLHLSLWMAPLWALVVGAGELQHHMSGFVLCCSASQGSSFVFSFDWARVPGSVSPAALPSIPSLAPLCRGPICQSLSGNSLCFESTASDWPVSVPSASVLHVRRPSGLSPAQPPCPRPRGAPYPSGVSPPREEHGA